MNFKIAAGRQGEETAVRYLQSNGYRVLERNVRARLGEIDIVAREGATLCFIEVKARSSARFGWPEEAVTFRKRQRLLRLAQLYLRRHPTEARAAVRFDVLSILSSAEGDPGRIRLIKGAFEAG